MPASGSVGLPLRYIWADGAADLLQRVNATDTIFNLPTGSANRTLFLVVKYIDAEGVGPFVDFYSGLSPCCR